MFCYAVNKCFFWLSGCYDLSTRNYILVDKF